LKVYILFMNVYHTIAKEGESAFSDRGSKFLGYAFPVVDSDDGKAKLQLVKKKHPKASHYCFAWRIGQEGEATRVSDAGEPSGSAGRPILGQIQSRDLTNLIVVVVRYFGGSLLGIPGLINAYKSAASDALNNAGTITKKIEIRFSLNCDYTVMNEVMQVFRQFDTTIHESEQLLFCRFMIGVPVGNREQFEKRLAEIKGVELSLKTE
jgi:uncharacterized YigZ family protein